MSSEQQAQIQKTFVKALEDYLDKTEYFPENMVMIPPEKVNHLIDIANSEVFVNGKKIQLSIHQRYNDLKKFFQTLSPQKNSEEERLITAITRTYQSVYPPQKLAEQKTPAHENTENPHIKAISEQMQEKQKSVDALQKQVDSLQNSLDAVNIINNKLKQEPEKQHQTTLEKNKADIMKNLDSLEKEIYSKIEKKKGLWERLSKTAYETRVGNEKFEIMKLKEKITDQIEGTSYVDIQNIRDNTLKEMTKKLSPLNNSKLNLLQNLEDYQKNLSKTGNVTQSKVDKSIKDITDKLNDMNSALKKEKDSLEDCKNTLDFLKQQQLSLSLPSPSLSPSQKT